jgi:transposase, IS5 family
MRQGEQGVRLEPLLEAISDFLDDQRDMIECIRRDLVRGLKKPGSGRSGLTAKQILRSLVLGSRTGTRERIADGLTLRQFTDLLLRGGAQTRRVSARLHPIDTADAQGRQRPMVQAAVDLGLEDGARLRVDTTVVQSDIHHPTDNTLLWDVVRVVTRLVGRLAKALELWRIRGSSRWTAWPQSVPSAGPRTSGQ